MSSAERMPPPHCCYLVCESLVSIRRRRCKAWRSAARCRSNRPAVATLPKSKLGWSTCSASRTAGAARCARCFGPIPASSFLPLPAGRAVDLPVPCTFDFNVAATKYFHSLDDGEIPLVLQFSGTIFYVAEDGRLQIAQIAWDKEAKYRMPVGVWQEMMRIFYPNGAWLRLRKDVFERLLRYKAEHGNSDLGGGRRTPPFGRRGARAKMNATLVDRPSPPAQSLVEQLASALLYEGYILYPYRATAVKNQQRFNFGGLYPPAYSQAPIGADASRMQTECLVLAKGNTTLSIRIRFLHLIARQIGRREASTPEATPVFQLVDSVEVAGRKYYSWQEAIEREVPLPPVHPCQLAGQRFVTPFPFPPAARSSLWPTSMAKR